jgi:uncharacterized protein
MYGTNMVVDVNSGSVHVFDDISFDVLDYYGKIDNASIIDKLSGKYDNAQVQEAIDEIEALKSQGQLFSDDEYKEHLPLLSRKPVVKALCLNISHDCNLRCKYCFAATGDFGGERKLMSPATGKNAIDFLIGQPEGRRNLEVDFFGGEPLMNFDAVKEITEYARSREMETGKKFRFTITTNGTLLNEENMNYINENMQNVVLSIDGRKETNDRMRTRINGSGTYDSILPKIGEMAESRNQDNYYVRGTYTRDNLDFSKDVLHLADLGFRQISVEPVVAAKDTGYDIRDEDLPQLFDEYEKLALEYAKRAGGKDWFNFFHFMIDLKQGPCIIKRLGGCGSGHEYLAVTPEGDIYPCHQFVGMNDFKMGNVNISSDINMEIRDMFVKQTIYSKPDCKECWAKFFCSGGCAANAWQFNNCLDKPYEIGCELERKRVECALWAKVMELTDI